MWPESYDVTPVYQNLFKSVKPFMSYRLDTIFSGLGHSDLDPDSSNPNTKLDLNLVKLRSYFVPKLVKICEAFYEFSSRNHEN